MNMKLSMWLGKNHFASVHAPRRHGAQSADHDITSVGRILNSLAQVAFVGGDGWAAPSTMSERCPVHAPRRRGARSADHGVTGISRVLDLLAQVAFVGGGGWAAPSSVAGVGRIRAGNGGCAALWPSDALSVMAAVSTMRTSSEPENTSSDPAISSSNMLSMANRETAANL
jgi:hypothetical protein